jgi:hypothetical protein
MKYKDLEIGDDFKSTRFENLVFTKIQPVKATCCKPGHNATGVGHNTKVMFAEEDEVEKVDLKKEIK